MTTREDDFRNSLLALQAQWNRTDEDGNPVVDARTGQPVNRGNATNASGGTFDDIFSEGFQSFQSSQNALPSTPPPREGVDAKKALQRLIDRIERFYERKDVSAYALTDEVYNELLDIQKLLRQSIYQVNSPHVQELQDENNRLKQQVKKFENMYQQETTSLKRELQQIKTQHERDTREMREKLEEYEKKRTTLGSTRKITKIGELPN